MRWFKFWFFVGGFVLGATLTYALLDLLFTLCLAPLFAIGQPTVWENIQPMYHGILALLSLLGAFKGGFFAYDLVDREIEKSFAYPFGPRRRYRRSKRW